MLSVAKEGDSNYDYPPKSAGHNHLPMSTIPSLTNTSSFPNTSMSSNPSVTGDSSCNPNAVSVNDTSGNTLSPSRAGTNSDQQKDGRPKYTPRLVRRILAEPDDIDAFDEQEWRKKVYGPDVIVFDHKGLPPGWIMIADPHPPTTKIKKRWNPYESISTDANVDINCDRVLYGLPPVDSWNIGVEYEWDEKDLRRRGRY